ARGICIHGVVWAMARSNGLRALRSSGRRYAARVLAGVAIACGASGQAAAQTPELPVVAARQALDARLWDRLASIAAVASNDLLGAYPQYWLLRQQVHDTRTPLPMPAITRFLQEQHGTYLEQKMRADAIRVAARMGDFDSVRRLADGIILVTPQTQCAI